MASVPDFYNPERIGTLFYPDKEAIAAAAHQAELQPSAEDARKMHLLIIDMQVDFCHKNGSLYVPGAEDDIKRTIEFIYRNAERISWITCTLDSHLPHQIFSSNWWVDEEGRHPEPYTIIQAEDVATGRWIPVKMPEWSVEYVHALEEQAKKTLTIWPYHVLIGSPGYMLDPELWSAVTWHSLARNTVPHWLQKGSIPQTEHYSAIEPEIDVPGHPSAGRNDALLNELAVADAVYIAGEAESHCVLETVEDIVAEFSEMPAQLMKMHLLQDCTSPVVHPQIDFHALAQERFSEFSEQGLQLVNSVDSIA